MSPAESRKKRMEQAKKLKALSHSKPHIDEQKVYGAVHSATTLTHKLNVHFVNLVDSIPPFYSGRTPSIIRELPKTIFLAPTSGTEVAECFLNLNNSKSLHVKGLYIKRV